MAANLTGQVRAIALVTTAVANGDLSKKITAEAQVFALFTPPFCFLFFPFLSQTYPKHPQIYRERFYFSRIQSIPW